MKKLISFILSLAIVFSLCAFVSVLAEPQLEAESVCNNVYKTFEFTESNFNKEYSSENAEVQFNEDGFVTIKFKENIKNCTLYFNVENPSEIGKILNEEKYGFKEITEYKIFTEFSLKSKSITGSSDVLASVGSCKEILSNSLVINRIELTSQPYNKKLYIVNSSHPMQDFSNFVFVNIVNTKDDLSDSEITVSPIICQYAFSDHNIIVVDKEEPTCEKEGSTGREYCTECKQYFSDNWSSKPLEHKRTEKGAKVATYFKKGYTGDICCSECDKVFESGKIIPIKKLEKTTISDVIKGKKRITVKYKKVVDATGYEIQVCKNGRWVKSTTKKLKYTAKNLSKGKTYKIKIRAFVKSGKQIKYSNYSIIKKVKL